MNSKIIDTFISGVKLFNKGETLAGHAKWESLWKVGDLEIRKWIKGWLQFSGSILNVFAEKREGAIYLAGKSINKTASVLFSPPGGRVGRKSNKRAAAPDRTEKNTDRTEKNIRPPAGRRLNYPARKLIN